MRCLHLHSSLHTGTLGNHMVSILARLSITGRSGAFASFFAMWEKTRSISCGNKLICCCSSQGFSSLFAQSTFVYLLLAWRGVEGKKIFLPLWIWSASSDHRKWEQIFGISDVDYCGALHWLLCLKKWLQPKRLGPPGFLSFSYESISHLWGDRAGQAFGMYPLTSCQSVTKIKLSSFS